MPQEYIEKLKKALKGRVAVFIDAANLGQSVRDMWVNPKDIPNELKHHTVDELYWAVDYKKLREFFSSITPELKSMRFYTPDFESESHFKFLYFLRRGLHFLLNTKPLKKYGDHTDKSPHRKANFDVEIAVDATFSLDKFDTLILFSGDSDFAYLLRFLRGQGKIAIVFSRSGHVAKELPPASNHYFDIVDFRDDFLKVSVKAKSPA